MIVRGRQKKGAGANGTKLGATYFMPDASLAASVMVLAAA
jgi:hypothetical protein